MRWQQIQGISPRFLLVPASDGMHLVAQGICATAPQALVVQPGMELLRLCDGVFAIPGGQQSNGARREVEFARQHGMPVFESIGEIESWLAAAIAQP
jgi:Domain of unknown function (DUF4406)